MCNSFPDVHRLVLVGFVIYLSGGQVLFPKIVLCVLNKTTAVVRAALLISFPMRGIRSNPSPLQF